jgi:hypothetical protein
MRTTDAVLKEIHILITADELYRLAGIVPNGTTSWDDKEGVLPGVYVISITETPTEIQRPFRGARAFVLAAGSVDCLYQSDPL